MEETRSIRKRKTTVILNIDKPKTNKTKKIKKIEKIEKMVHFLNFLEKMLFFEKMCHSRLRDTRD